jgi:sterol desaturase/sphingolipid hydroxylase (fatty acid hydroxylase superfamily)
MSIKLLETYLSRLLDLTPTLAATIGGMYLLMSAIEYFVPAEKGHTWSGRCRNFTYTLIYLAVGTLALNGLTQYLPSIAPRVYRHEHPMLFAWLYLAVSDFFYYWYHRLQHRWPLLWRIHELHHSDAELNVTTSLRTHWLEKPVQYLVVGIPTVLVLGIDPPAIFWSVIFGQIWEMFTHANVRCFVAPWAAVLCNPSIHRVHHSRLRQHHQCNFAQNFTVYDMLFGTYIAPERETLPPTGTAAIPSNYSVLKNTIRPFLIRPVAASVEARSAEKGRKRRDRRTATHSRRKR